MLLSRAGNAMWFQAMNGGQAEVLHRCIQLGLTERIVLFVGLMVPIGH